MYSVVISLLAAIFIGLFSTCSKMKKEFVEGDQHKTVVNKVDILTFDNSELQEEAKGECTCFSFTLLEIIVSGVLCLGFLAGMVKLAFCLRWRLLEQKEM